MPHVLPNTYMLALVPLDRALPTPLHRQIYAGLRAAILNRQLEPGMRLPSTRDLASMLQISRNTVLNAIDQLLAEGYLDTRPGSGTYVTNALPEEMLRAFADSPAAQPDTSDVPRALSRRGRQFTQRMRSPAPDNDSLKAAAALFPVSAPALDLFPFDVWARLTGRFMRRTPPRQFGYEQDRTGYRPLREAIASYVRTARAARCEPEQIIIVSGSQQAIFNAGQVLLDAGDPVWFEDPGYSGARDALEGVGARLVPVPVDEEGLSVCSALRQAPAARAAYVSPSHQFPLGYTMSLNRRAQLLNWAQDRDGWILEDDYDSAFRYHGRPVASLQGLDVYDRVIYIGTFSKVLFPALRLGYLIVPNDLVDAFTAARQALDIFPALTQQAVLADFIAGGHFTRHIRRMRSVYEERRDAFVDALSTTFGGNVSLSPTDTGMHLVLHLPGHVADGTAFTALRKAGLTSMPLSYLYVNRPVRQGLILGFSAAMPDVLRNGVKRLAAALEPLLAARACP